MRKFGFILFIGCLCAAIPVFAQPEWEGSDSRSRSYNQLTTAIPDSSEVFTVVEEMPEFVNGGIEGLKKYIIKNTQYPKNTDAQGTVYIQVIVRPDGSMDHVKLLRGIKGCEECDKEALRVIKSLPKWKPGKQNGKTVSVYYNIPVRFKLQ